VKTIGTGKSTEEGHLFSIRNGNPYSMIGLVTGESLYLSGKRLMPLSPEYQSRFYKHFCWRTKTALRSGSE